jgi:hypothetical protein
MSEVFQITALEWQPVRLDVARGVYGKAPGRGASWCSLAWSHGKFSMHRDDYVLFYFLEGEGIVCVGDKRYRRGRVGCSGGRGEHC